MSNKQIKRDEAMREIAAIRERVLTLKEQMKPLPHRLAWRVNACLHSLQMLEDQTRQHYRWSEESP